MAGNPEEEKLWLKLAIYLFGTSLGVAAKLAVMHRQKSIVLKDVIVNSIIAFAAAWLVYALLDSSGMTQYATVCSVLSGRFADDIIQMIWKGIRAFLKTSAEEIK